MQEELIEKLTKVPHTKGVYGYLFMTRPVQALLRIQPEFNTFNEVLSDLRLFKPQNWYVSEKNTVPDPRMVCYEIVGNGFLKQVDN